MLEAGDLILSYDLNSGQVTAREIRRTIHRTARTVFKVQLLDGSFKATRGHAFLTDKGWKQTRRLANSELMLIDGKVKEVISVTVAEQKEEVYNLRSAGEHSFIIQGGIISSDYCCLQRIRGALDDAVYSLRDLAKTLVPQSA